MGEKKKVLDLLGDVVETAGKGVKKELKKASNKSGKQDDLFPETIPTTSEGQKAANKLSAAEKRKFKKAQTDMFPDALKDATEARKVKTVKKRKDAMRRKRKDPEVENGITQKDLDRAERQLFPMKPKKKAAGGPIKKFGAGGWVTKQLKKGAGKAAEATGKAADAVKKKTKKELAKIKRSKNIKNKTITKSGPVTKSSDFDTGSSKHMPLMKKQEEIQKRMDAGKFDKPIKEEAKGHYGKLRRGEPQGKAGGGVVKKYAGGGPVRKSIDGIAQRGLTRAKHK